MTPDDDAVDGPEETFGLVMPFVVCRTNGGPFDDDAFVAGADWALIDAQLAHPSSTDTFERWVRTDLVPQVDLSAMRHGWTTDAQPWADHPDEWTLVTFEKAAPT